MKVVYAFDTHVGMCRPENEDSVLLMPEKGLFAVADGMGGQGHGGVASRLAVDAMRDYFERGAPVGRAGNRPHATTNDPNVHRLVGAISGANERILGSLTSQPGLTGMGTTIVAAYLTSGRVYVGHVGDSRAYLYRDKELTRLTKDHTMVEEFKETRDLSAEEEKRLSAFNHVVARSLGGLDAQLKVDVRAKLPKQNDVYLLCSDGLTGELSDREIRKVLEISPSINAACQMLIKVANKRGGRDNISVILLGLQ